jgi:hypothetical protein
VKRRSVRATAMALVVLTWGCGKPRLDLPTGPFTPVTDATAALADAFGHCTNLQTMTLELALSGRAAGQRVRARLLAGLTADNAIRLEAVAPFGPPGFILAGNGQTSVLLLPRDDRVLRDVPPREILAALAGVHVEPRELLAFLSGCPGASPSAVGARAVGEEWMLVDLGDMGGLAYLKRRTTWTPTAVVRDRLRVVFDEWRGQQPGLVRLESVGAPGRASFELALRPSQVERNVTLPASAFSVEIPADAEPITIEELRRAGPMRDSQPDDRVS